LLVAKLQGDPAKLLQQQGALINVDTVLPTSPPPRVTIVQPTPGFTTAQREVEVQLLLTDQGGGLGKVVWNIDGVTLGVTRASSPRTVRGQATPHAQRLPLAPGTNTITVVAYDQRDLVISAQATVTVHLASPPLAPPPATPSVPPP